MKVYSIEKREYYTEGNFKRILHHNLIDVVSSKKKVIETLFYLGVTNQKGHTKEDWSMRIFPEESYTKKFTIDKYEYEDVVIIKEWKQY